MFPTRYEPLFFNSNFTEAASTCWLVAYRGELILQEGEVADAQGRRKPPTEVLKQAILLGDVDGLKLISGSLDELQQFQFVLETAGADFNSGYDCRLFHGQYSQALRCCGQRCQTGIYSFGARHGAGPS
jgi:hypothetical protein